MAPTTPASVMAQTAALMPPANARDSDAVNIVVVMIARTIAARLTREAARRAIKFIVAAHMNA
jgi:hypothetical protein